MEKANILCFTNPATGEEFGQVAMHTPEQVRQARRDMGAAAKIWSQKPVKERVRILRKFQEVMIEASDEISAVLNQDTGKSRQDALIEVFMTTDMLQQYLKHAPRWLRRERVSSGIYVFKRSYVERKPQGVVGVIAPWNYPFALTVPPVLAALLAGNTVLLKPSEVTAATGVLLESLFNRVPELAPFIRVLHGDGEVGAAMVASKPDHIFLTGSTATGKLVLKAAADHLIPVTCELGGKDAMIVLEDADIASAAHWGVWGAFFNAGQTCMAVERVYVVEPVYEEFVRRAVKEAKKLLVGYTQDLDSPYYIGPITDPRQVKVIERHLKDALEKGAGILTGGGKEGRFIEPTILVDVTHDMLVMQEETFGTLMPIVKVKDEVEAIRMANDSKFGLGASVWSKDIHHAERVAHQLEAASIIINDTIAQFAIALLPFGGIKQSGNGRTHGKEGLLQFTQPYSYALGNPPQSWDLATIARKPGNYRVLSWAMHLLFGVTLKQRMQAVTGMVESLPVKPSRRGINLGIALSALGAMSAVVAIARRGKHG